MNDSTWILILVLLHVGIVLYGIVTVIQLIKHKPTRVAVLGTLVVVLVIGFFAMVKEINSWPPQDSVNPITGIKN